MRRILVLAAAALAVACTPLSDISPPGSTTARADAIEKVAAAAADIADALEVVPPATIAGNTTIPERGVRVAFLSFDAALTAVNLAIDLKAITPGSPAALRIRGGVFEVKRWLNAASAAQRASNAASYREALEQAKRALAGVRTELAR